MKHKSLTELALKKRHDAHRARLTNPSVGDIIAAPIEHEASDILVLAHPSDVGAGGEVVQAQVAGLPIKRDLIKNTLAGGASRIAEDASLRRTDLLLQENLDVVAMAVDAAESIEANNSLEKMLAHQMALAHEASVRFMDRALGYDQSRAGGSVEAARLANTSARLMSEFRDGLLALQKIRTGGNQTVTVQHVNVQPGAQAVIGNVQAGGTKRRGRTTKNG